MMDTNFMNGMFGKIAPGMCKLSMSGGIAVKTSTGYKSYNIKSGRLTNCSNFVFGNTEEFFFVIPTNKVEIGDIILIAGKPKCVKVRECRDSEEHPNTIPVILALDVTGSMGSACAAVARQLDKIITGLYEDIKDVEFMVMGIGDFACDYAPLQVSQFESDIRICDQLGKIWFEGHGGGNAFESYTAAWYFALKHTDLDCWKRGKKGIIITLGDEPLNPYLPGRAFDKVFGYSGQDIDTTTLYEQVIEKYDIYHIVIADRETSARYYEKRIEESWGKLLDGQHLFTKLSDDLPEVIHDIVLAHVDGAESASTVTITEEGIAW